MTQKQIEKIPMSLPIEVVSSNIKSISFNKEHFVLEVEFLGGSKYRYHPVTEEAFIEFARASSSGGYFHQNIKNNNLIKHFKM